MPATSAFWASTLTGSHSAQGLSLQERSSTVQPVSSTYLDIQLAGEPITGVHAAKIKLGKKNTLWPKEHGAGSLPPGMLAAAAAAAAVSPASCLLVQALHASSTNTKCTA